MECWLICPPLSRPSLCKLRLSIYPPCVLLAAFNFAPQFRQKEKKDFISPLFALHPAFQLHSSFNLAFCENLKKRVDSFDKRKKEKRKRKRERKKKRPLQSKG